MGVCVDTSGGGVGTTARRPPAGLLAGWLAGRKFGFFFWFFQNAIKRALGGPGEPWGALGGPGALCMGSSPAAARRPPPAVRPPARRPPGRSPTRSYSTVRQAPKYVTKPQICNNAPNVRQAPKNWIFYFFPKCPKRALGDPGGPWGGPGAPHIFPFLGCCAVGTTSGAIDTCFHSPAFLHIWGFVTYLGACLTVE